MTENSENCQRFSSVHTMRFFLDLKIFFNIPASLIDSSLLTGGKQEEQNKQTL